MTAISQDLQFFENQSSYTNKGDLYNTGNTMLTAIKTFRDELEAQKVAANTTVATTTTAYTNMFNNLSSALTQNNTISSLNNLSVDEGLYNDKVDIFGNAKGVSLNNARASYTGYYYIRFNKNIPTTTLETGFSYSNDVLTIIPINLTIPITSEINHLYVERTASLLGVWLNGILVSSNNVTVYKSLAFTPPATHSFSIYADQVRTFSSALTVTEIARLLYQFANKFTPEPLFAGSTMPYTVSSGNPIYTNFNTSALGFDKTVIVKPTLTLETGEFINTSLTQIDFNVNTNTDISVCLVVGLGNLNASTTTVTLLPRVTTPNTTIVLNSSNATEWNDSYSVSASSTYAGISSATAVSTLTTYPINPLTTTTKLVSDNITASNSSIIKVKVGGVVTDIPANSPYISESITPSIDYRGLAYGMANTVVFNGTSTLLNTSVSQTVLKDADFILELELNPTVWDAYRGVFGDHYGSTGIVGFQNGADLAYSQSLSVPNTMPHNLFPINTWSKLKVEQKVINSTQVVVSVFVNDVLINRGIGNKLIPSGGNLIIGRGFNGSDRYFSGSMRNIKLITRSASQPTPVVTGGNYVDLYASGNYVWGLYLTTTVATIVRTNTFDIAFPTTYQLPLFYSDYRLSYVSDTEMYVVSATKQYKFNGSSFTAIVIGSAVNNYHIISSDTSQINLGVLTTSADVITVVMKWKWSGVDSVLPFGFYASGIWLNAGNLGFNTGNTDVYGITAPANTSTTFKTYVFKFKTGSYGDMWVDGVKQTLSQKLGSINTANAIVKNTNAYIFGYGNGTTSYRNAGSVDFCRIIEGDVTDAEVSTLTTNTNYTSLKTAFGSRLIRNLEFNNKDRYCDATLTNYVLSGTASFGLTPTFGVDNVDILGAGTGKALYRFDGDYKDTTDKYNLTLVRGTPTYPAMKYGTGIQTSGYGNCLTLPSLSYSGATTRVYSFWVKFPVVTDYYNWVFGGAGADTMNSANYSWFINATNGYLSNVSSTYTECPVVANTLYHIVIQVNHTTGDFSIYMDKVLKKTGIDTLFTRPYDNGYTYQFLGFNDTYFNYGTPAMIDQFRIIDLGRAITQTDVDTLYTEQTPIKYNFEDNGSSATGQYNFTPSGSITYTTGKVGKAVSFGTSGILGLTANPIPKPANHKFSMTCWYKKSAGERQTVYFGLGRKSGNSIYGSKLYFRISPFTAHFGKAQIGDYTSRNKLTAQTDTTNFHHYGVTLDGVSIRFYIDGLLVETIAMSSSDISCLNEYTNFYGFLEEVNHTASALSVTGLMDSFTYYPNTLTAEEIYNDFISGNTPTLTLANHKVAGNKVISDNGNVYKIVNNSIYPVMTLAKGTSTNFWSRKSVGMSWEALNLNGKLYNLTTGVLIATTNDGTTSYGTVKNDILYVANLLTDRTIRKYTLLNNFYGGEIVMLGTLPVGTLKMVGYWFGVHIKVDKLVEQRDICAVQTATQTIFYYNDGSNWNAFFTLNELTSFADSDSVIKNCNFEVLYGTYNPAGLTVNLASIPTGNAVVTNSGLAIGLATSNTTTIPTSFDSLTPTSSVFNFDTATVTDSYGSWVSAINGNFLHTKLTGALTNLTSLTLNTVK